MKVKGLKDQWPVAGRTRCQPVQPVVVRKGPSFLSVVAPILLSYFKASCLEQRRFLKFEIRSCYDEPVIFASALSIPIHHLF